MLLGSINAIPFRRRFGGGGGTPFPYIPGMIARYSGAGLTNEDMSANPVWKDLMGNGYDLQMKNFGWAGMSGVGGYEFNFLSSDWFIPSDQTIERFSHKIVIISKQHSAQLQNTSRLKSIKITIKVTGLEANGSTLRIYDNIGNDKKQDYNKDGIYKIDYTANEGANIIFFYAFGGNTGTLDTPITIEQLPLYPGALVFDGVDDYGTCNNFPILTKEKGYTVVALRQWIEEKNSITALVSNSKNWNQDGAFVFEYNNLENNYPNIEISFGSNTKLGKEKSSFTYQTSKLYNGKEIKFGEFLGSDRLTVAKANENLSPNSNVAIWELVFLDHDATEEELTKIKDYFVKTYPWFFPDQAWTVTGKTNEDEDRATIANITGNGNDLVLSDFGFIEGSGYNEEGEYAGYLVTDGVDDSGRAVGLTISKDFTLVGEWILFSKTSVNAGLAIHPQIHIFNRPEAILIMFRTAGKTLPVKSLKAICSDGRCYDETWSELKINVGEFTDNKGTLFVARNGTNYAQIAFKNLGIYDNQILSKNDCIKAYNYLQTLKAK